MYVYFAFMVISMNKVEVFGMYCKVKMAFDVDFRNLGLSWPQCDPGQDTQLLGLTFQV